MEEQSPLVERALARRTLASFARALRLESHNLAAHPELAWQQLINRLQWAPVPAALIDAAAARQPGNSQLATLRVRTRPRESHALLRRLDHRSDWLLACAFIPKSDLLVSACADRTLRLWDVATGRPVRVLAGLPAAPLSCTATRDGRYVIATTGNPAGTVHVWEVRTGRHVAQAAAHKPSCTACAVCSDGNAALTFGTDGRIRQWTLPDLRPLEELEPAPEPLTCGTLSPDGNVLAYGGRQGVLHVRTPPRGDSVTELVHGAGVALTGCAAGAHGGPLVTCGEDGQVVVWDLPTGHRTDLPCSGVSAVDCALADDGSLLAAATDDGRVRLWELPGGRGLGVLNAHTSTAVGCALSSTADTVASVSGDGTVCLWDVGAASESMIGGHTGLVEQCAFVNGGSMIATASTDGTARFWETDTGRESGTAVAHPGQTVLLLARDHDLVLAAGDYGTVLRVVRPPIKTPSSLEEPEPEPEPAREPVRIGEHGAQVWGLAALPRGSVVTGGRDGMCRVWNVAQQAECLTYPGDGSPVRACAAAPDGTFVASVGDNGRLHAWDPVTGTSLLGRGWLSAAVRTVAIGAGGAVVTGGTDGTVILGPADSTRMPRTIGRHEGTQISSALWIAGNRVVTCGVDGSLALWSADQDLGMWHRQAHRGPVLCVAASPSGTVLVTGGADSSVKLWESKTGRPLACLPCPGRVLNAAVHPHAPIIAAVGDGGLVCIAGAIGLKIVW